jgi:hypothetical protein
MPMKRMLDVEGVFDPKAVAVLFDAFDGAVAELGLRTDADRERAAKIIIDLACGRATLDAETLRHEAVGLMQGESVEVHDLDLNHS